ncbi:uncharacterized protein LOC107753594 [Sinocyclocheilus rhinocerous]|uniref:uncharacterized protein LOC107753594 n=1 Tax=Sinocyclocheilus rhinocerous TaxID=307959 RepID=UPI0007B86393|nr:PREDICTED: uncharacterized protein LOC107753594 [Sinocyclocheilus rhinocerous]
MESVGVICSPTGASFNLLSLPASCPCDEDEESLGLEGIKPKSSPIPRRRSSASSDDSLPPPSSSRRVSFADAFGLSLVSVKQFDAWGVTDPSGSLEIDLNEDKEYYMVPLFTLPQTSEELALRVHEQKLELESLELLSGTTTLRGIVRVLNISFDKMVYVRTSLDSWKSHFDLLAEYVPGSNNGGADCFSFKLTLVPPFGEEGARVDFCLRYETSLGTFWANNNEKNYCLFCCEKMKEKPQNESENRRKSCLKTTSLNVSASTVSATHNEEFPDINLNSGSLKENSEKLESKELVEEMNRNRGRRSRRKAARLAKVKEHFAKREEEKKQGTKTKETEGTADTSMQEHASLLKKTPCSSLSQQTARPPTCNQISPSPAESLKSAEYSGDSTDIVSQAITQDEEDNIIHSKTNLSTANTNLPLEDSISCDESIACSASEVLEDIQHTECITDQTVSINQAVPVCQNPDLSISKNVEKAWKEFEKDAKQRIKILALSSKMHEDMNISDGKPKEDVSLKTNSEPQLYSHGFTFGTIVAPLYHQVFKNMEIGRKDFFPKALDRSFRKLEDESQRAVTAPETTDIWPESCISTKQTVDDINVGVCKESTEQNSQLAVNPTKKPLPEPTESKHVKNAEASYNQNYCTRSTREYPRDITFTETTPPKVISRQVSRVCTLTVTLALTECSIQDDPCQSLCLFPQQGPELLVTTNQTIESGTDSLPERIHPSSATAVLKTSSCLDNQRSCIKTEKSQNQEDPTIIHTKEENISEQTEYSISTSCFLAQAPEDPTRSTLSSSDDKLEPDCCEMRSSIEKLKELSHLAIAKAMPIEPLENTQINMSNTLESYQMNEKEEQILMGFSTQTSETESSNIINFDAEHNTSVIKEMEEIHKMKNDESLEELKEGNGNQIKQMEKQKQDKEEKDQEPEEQEGAEEKHESEGRINSIEEELKYIDDEEDLDAMESEKEEKQQADEDDLLSLEQDSEEQKQIISTSTVESLPHNIDLKGIESLGEYSEKEDIHVNLGLEICEETAASWQESSQKSDIELSGSTQAMENDWNHFEFIDKEENVSYESMKSDWKTIDDVNNMLENMECLAKDRDLENVEDNTSTE